MGWKVLGTGYQYLIGINSYLGIPKIYINMNQESQTSIVNKSDKKTKLILSLIFDGIGMLSYIVPIFAESLDVIWAPISGLLLVIMYKGTVGKIAGLFGTVEELIPLTDIIPTFTITWFYTYIIRKEA